MPRPERPLDGLGGPIEQFAAELRQLREKAGRPGYRQMAARVNYSVATLSAAASGRRLPTLEVTLAYVAACDGDPQEWERHWREAERRSAAPAEDPDTADGHDRAPYPGLVTFQPEDADLFFGRAALADELVRRLRERRFLAVFGPSGAGKSSVVRAGLIPAAGRPAMVLTPGAHPMGELAVHLARHVGVPAGGLLDELRRDPARANLLVRQGLPGARTDVDLLVVVDQFEEVFVNCADAAERNDFVAALLAMCREPDGRARVVLAVRADHYVRFTEYPELLATLADSQVLIGGMSPTELRETVTRPAERRGARVEGALVATIVAEVSGSPGALPMAAHALREAWFRRQGAVVTLAGYQAAGGVAGAVAHTAEAVYNGFDDRQRDTARQVLVRLVALGEGVEDTRRRIRRGDLDLPGLGAVLDRLAAARLIVLDEDTVEIAHEALIRAWPRLQRWLSVDRDGLRTHRQLTEAARSWESLSRDPGALYRGARLAVAREWAGLDGRTASMTAAERAFLDASIEQAGREQAAAARRNRQLSYLVAALSVLLVAVVGAGTVAFLQRRDAVAQQQIAVSRQLAAESLGLTGTEPETAMLLAVQAYRTAPTIEARSALLSMSAHRGHLGKLLGHTGAVSRLAFRPDGNTLLSVGRDRTLSLWDTGRRARTAVLTGHDTWLTAAAVSPDGRTAATGGDDRKIAVWDLDRRGRIATLTGLSEQVQDIAFSPDGRRLAAATGNDVILWDLQRQTRGPVLSGHTRAVRALAFSPDGRTLATASTDSTAILWDLTRSAPIATLTGHTGGVYAIGFSPDGSTLATGGDATTIMWDVATRTRLATLSRKSGQVLALTFSPDGRTLVTAGDDTSVLLWDTRHRILRARLAGPRTSVYTLAFSPRTSMLAAGGEDGAILLWDLRQPTTTEHPTMVNAVAFSPDGNTLATTSRNRTALWNAADRSLRTILPDNRVFTNAVAFSPDGHTLATVTQPSPCCPPGEAGNTLTLWNLHAGTAVRLAGHTAAVLDLAFSPDGGRIATVSVDRTVKVWDASTGVVLKTVTAHAGPVNGVAFSPDGRLLATAGHDGTVKLWDARTGAELAALTGHTSWVRSVAFSPDGRIIASAGHDQSIILWGVATHTRLTTITDHSDADFTGTAFSPDGRTLAYTSGEADIVLWDVQRRAATARLTGHTDRVHAVAFSPDGNTIASAGSDQTLIVQDVNPQRAITQICTATVRNLTPEVWRRYLPTTPYTDTCPKQ
ncbi:nSTAND1 domain-containing NTPase [Paractinoplanes brasiliensis]|uniref:WD40 repeat protein n=1 Tax=Paractinoplanes brasiliensis TaxID=52695 RepID=A0A4R6JMH8_9ACTN|nr:PD40 domain-containing protein [Actinoplanes brasiliensis]TDO36932.1 WD40 repeat protein [Actinoplanes brasiliensis]GID30454.1 hypothetical protein Abr02nite_54370 [Actinoplanes brasiliensis]